MSTGSVCAYAALEAFAELEDGDRVVLGSGYLGMIRPRTGCGRVLVGCLIGMEIFVENGVGVIEEKGAKVLEVDWPDDYDEARKENRICRRRRC
jgi:hypothetical protein